MTRYFASRSVSLFFSALREFGEFMRRSHVSTRFQACVSDMPWKSASLKSLHIWQSFKLSIKFQCTCLLKKISQWYQRPRSFDSTIQCMQWLSEMLRNACVCMQVGRQAPSAWRIRTGCLLTIHSRPHALRVQLLRLHVVGQAEVKFRTLYSWTELSNFEDSNRSSMHHP